MASQADDWAERGELGQLDAFLSVMGSRPDSEEAVEAFRLVFDELSIEAVRIARQHGSACDAEDAVQEALLKLWSAAKAGTVETEGEHSNPKAWFITTLINEAKSLARKRADEMKRQERLGEETRDLVRLGYDPEAQYLYMDKLLDDPDYAALLRVAIASLGEEDRDLVRRRYVLHEPYDVIAADFGSTAVTLRQRLRRIRLRLKTAIEAAASGDQAE